MSRADSPLRERAIFVVGARRSGTFWLQRIVAAHPEVAEVPGETYLFSHGIAPLLERFHHRSKSARGIGTLYADREELLDAARDFCDRVFLPYLSGDARFLVERTPLHALHLDVIASVYPDARVAHIVRDGRDVVRSLLARSWGPSEVEAAADEWRASVIAARGGRRLFQYAIEVRYEELLADPEHGVRSIYEGLGLPAGPAALEKGLTEAGVPVNVDPTVAALGSEKWRGRLSRRELRAVERCAGDLLRDLGYLTEAGRSPFRPGRVRTLTRGRGRGSRRGARHHGGPGTEA